MELNDLHIEHVVHLGRILSPQVTINFDNPAAFDAKIRGAVRERVEMLGLTEGQLRGLISVTALGERAFTGVRDIDGSDPQPGDAGCYPPLAHFKSCTPDCILTALDLLFVVPKNTLLRAEHDFFSLQLFRDVQQAAAQDGLVRRLLALVSFSDTKDPGMVRQAREDYDRLLAALDPDAGAARPVPPGTMWKSLVKQGLRPFGEILSGSYDCDQHGAWAVPQGAVDFVPMTDLAPEEGENIDITIALSKWFDIGRPTPKEAKALPVCPRCEQPPARRNRLWHRDVPSILFFEFPLDVPSGGDSTPTNISVQYFSKEYGLQRAVYSWLFTIGGVDVMGQRPDEVNNYVLYHAVTHSPNQILQYDVSNTTYGGETPLTIVQCEGDVENRVPKGCRKALVALERRPTRPGQLSYSDWLYRMENAADVEPYTESRVRMLPRESSGGELPGDDVPVTLS